MLKPIEPRSTATVVWHKDPAIVESDKIDDYVDKAKEDPGCWHDMLEMKKGHKPTQFVIGVIPPSDLVRMEADARLTDPENFKLQSLFWDCFLNGVRDIKNWGGEVKKVKRDGVEYVDPDWLEKQFAKHLRACGLFVGSVIWRWNNMPDSDSKNS